MTSTPPRSCSTAAARVRSDADFVFYNQPATPDGAVRHTATTSGRATSIETLHIAINNLILVFVVDLVGIS